MFNITPLSEKEVKLHLKDVRTFVLKTISLDTKTICFEQSYRTIYDLVLHKHSKKVEVLLMNLLKAYVPHISKDRLERIVYNLNGIFLFYNSHSEKKEFPHRLNVSTTRCVELLVQDVKKRYKGSWHRVRYLVPYIVVFLKMYDEVSYRPGNTAAKRARIHFEGCI